MPLYDYRCDTCGEFREWQSMSRSGEPVPCPSCRAPSPRSIQAPNMNLMAAGRRVAHERNEKSAHEPRVMTRSELDRVGKPMGHHHGHAHGHGSKPKGSKGRAHVHRSNRPWMVGH